MSDLNSEYKNIDPFLLIKSAMLARKYPTEKKQHFWLELQYKENTNTDEKSAMIFSQVGRFPLYHGHFHFVIDFDATLDTLLALSDDSDLVRVSGDVFPISA